MKDRYTYETGIVEDEIRMEAEILFDDPWNRWADIYDHHQQVFLSTTGQCIRAYYSLENEIITQDIPRNELWYYTIYLNEDREKYLAEVMEVCEDPQYWLHFPIR